ncbi:hypothetical protein AB0O01_05920 [Streptomyces sp. NPDC093252]|uniref:hypothetical protein n=1 Tax=Streptomyces sp. NPDC093252 TaxID=3154980 RepID=UPI003424A260
MPDRNVSEHHNPPQLRLGHLVFDTRTNSLGVVMDTGAYPGNGLYSLRPPRGGTEWDASPGDLRPATVTDRIRPSLAEVNARSSGGGSR